MFSDSDSDSQNSQHGNPPLLSSLTQNLPSDTVKIDDFISIQKCRVDLTSISHGGDLKIKNPKDLASDVFTKGTEEFAKMFAVPKQELTVAQEALLTRKKMSYEDFAYSKRFIGSSTEKDIFEITRIKPLKNCDTSAVSRLPLANTSIRN